MVYAFVISDVGVAEFSVLYKAVFGSENPQSNTEEADKLNADETLVAPPAEAVCEASRKKRQDSLRQLLQRVSKAYLLNLALGIGSPIGPAIFSSTQYGVSDSRRETGGIFAEELSSGDIPKTVIWHALEDSLCFVLVCDHGENRLMASKVLRHLVSFIMERSETCSPKELMRDISLVTAAVDVLLPSGQILFMNSNAVAQLNLRLRKIMKGANE